MSEEGKDTAVAEEEVDFFGQIENLLDKLIPDAEVTITKCDGTDVVLMGAISARQQVKAFRKIRDISEMPAMKEALGNVSGADSAAVIDLILNMATNEEISEKLGDLFSCAYPNALDGKDPLDELPLEEIVAGLLPFSKRFIKRVGSGIASMAKAAPTDER